MLAITDPELIFSTALRLDNEITHIFDDAPPGWMYETVYIDDIDSPLVFGGSYGKVPFSYLLPIFPPTSISELETSQAKKLGV